MSEYFWWAVILPFAWLWIGIDYLISKKGKAMKILKKCWEYSIPLSLAAIVICSCLSLYHSMQLYNNRIKEIHDHRQLEALKYVDKYPELKDLYEILNMDGTIDSHEIKDLRTAAIEQQHRRIENE